MTDATTHGIFAHRNVVTVVGNSNETKKRVRTSLDTSSNSETSSIDNNKRICYEGCGADDIITGLLSLDNSNNGINNSDINREINSNTSLCPPRLLDLPIPNPLAPPVPVTVPPVDEGQQQQHHPLLFPLAAGLALNKNDQDHAEAEAEAIAEVEEALFGTTSSPPSTLLLQKTTTNDGIKSTTDSDTTTTPAKKALFLCQRPLCAKPCIRAATGAAAANDVASSLLCHTTAKIAKGNSTPAAMMSRAIAPPPAATPAPLPAATPATLTSATPAAVQVQSRINIKSSSLPNTVPTTTTTTTTQTTAPLVLSAPPLPLPLPTNRSVIPAPANPTPAVSVSTSVPYRTYAYQQVQASAVVLPTTATARMNIATTTYRNPTTQQRLTLWKQQQLIQQQQQQVQRLAQQQQSQQRAQLQQHRTQHAQQQQQQQRQQQGIYHSDDDDSHRRTGTRRCPLSKPPQLPTTILK